MTTNKNIALCSDGTGNSGGKGQGTNVWRLYGSIDLHSFKTHPGNIEQIAFHDDGVGTQRFRLLRLLGGAIGYGLSSNVRTLYRRLVKNFEPGDHIYLFGFSRGAFTVRTLGGFITECGILNREHAEISSDRDLDRLIKKAYQAYRFKYRALLTRPLFWLLRKFGLRMDAEEFRKKYAVRIETGAYSPTAYKQVPRREAKAGIDVPDDRPEGERTPIKEIIFREGGEYIECPDGRVPIRFVGVWDTVDSVGLPFAELASFLNAVVYQFKFNRRTLSPWVDKACHALAIDDERRSFHPLLFDEKNSQESSVARTDEDRIEQVWFAGAHSNVGGGYPKQGLALVALHWMMKMAEAHGLRFTADASDSVEESRNVQDRLYESRAGLRIYYRYSPRDVEKLTAENCKDPDAKVHVSVLQRIALGTENYAPGNLPKRIRIVSTDETNQGEDRKTLDDLSTSLEVFYGKANRLLDRAKFAVLARKSIHYIGILVMLWLLKCEVPAINSFFKETGWLAFLGWCPEWHMPWLEQLLSWLPGGTDRMMLIITVAAAVIYTIDSLLRTWMNHRFSEFWRRVPKLSDPWWR